MQLIDQRRRRNRLGGRGHQTNSRLSDDAMPISGRAFEASARNSLRVELAAIAVVRVVEVARGQWGALEIVVRREDLDYQLCMVDIQLLRVDCRAEWPRASNVQRDF